jgi:hypothetical protein
LAFSFVGAGVDSGLSALNAGNKGMSAVKQIRKKCRCILSKKLSLLFKTRHPKLEAKVVQSCSPPRANTSRAIPFVHRKKLCYHPVKSKAMKSRFSRFNAAQWSLVLTFQFTAGAAELIRGPYLQSGSPTSVTVRWRTDVATDSRVFYGTNISDLDRSVIDTGFTREHQVALSGLRPNTTYFYSIGGGNQIFGVGPEFFFVTSPPNAKPTRLWVLGDAGTANFNQEAVRDAYYAFSANRHTDLWLMLGDNAYDIGTDFDYQGAVFNMYPEMLRKSVLWSTIGNHDTYSSDPNGEFPYLNIFSLPTAGQAGGVPSGTEKYYSFDYGNIHFIVLDSMSSDRSSNGPMCTWLTMDLTENTNQWLIALWHHPPYTKGSHDSDDPFGFDFELVEMRQNVVPILEAFGIDLVLCGHSHSYERSFLLQGHYGYSSDFDLATMALDSGSGRASETGAYRKEADHDPGTVYVVAGSSGRTSGGDLNHPAMFISLNELGSLVLDIDGPRLDATFLRSDGGIADSFTMLKPGASEPIRITSFAVSSGIATFTWTSEPGKTYHIERTKSLSSPQWQAVTPAVPSAAGPTTSWSGLIEPDAYLFYRVTRLNN